jgi:hypothetical protein
LIWLVCQFVHSLLFSPFSQWEKNDRRIFCKKPHCSPPPTLV